MADRNIVTRLRADITDLKAKMVEAAGLTSKVGDAAQQTSGKSRVAFGDIANQVRKNEASIGQLSNTALGVGAGLAVGVGGVVKTFADFDKQMSGVAATGDDARANIDGLREAAIQLGADSAFSATEAAAGVENLLKAGVDAGEVMGGGLKGALDLAAAGELEVADAAEIAATAMTQFKLEGEDVPRIADLLAAGAGKAQGEVSDLAGALNQSGLVASQFGLDIEETVGTLSAFASAGLLGSDAGTSFKTMLLQLANPSAKTAQEMDRLGISAYDAQGNFVGIAALADQLKNNLSGLTQAQRDAALAQIFGNDAVRAANVLYTQGASGINDWISKVDDQGFAAETASTKLDNLSGDVEAFTGALESAFIKSGSGGNDFLRSLVGNATDVVKVIGGIPGPVLETGFAVAGISAASLLAVGGLGKLVVGLVNAKDAFDAVAPAGGRARGAIATAGKVAAGAAIGIAAYTTAVSAAAKATDDPALVDGLEQTTEALLKLGGATDAAALDGLFQVADGDKVSGIAGGVDDLGSALDRALDPGLATRIADVGENIVLLGGSLGRTQADKVADQFAQLDTALTQMKPEQAAAAFNQLAEQAEAQGLSVAQLVELMPQYENALRAQANELGVTTLTAQDYADWMGGKVPSAVTAMKIAHENATTATSGTGDAMGSLLAAEDNLAKAHGELTSETDKMIKSFSILNDEAFAAEDAAVGYQAALDSLESSVKSNGASLDIHTEKGRANRAEISGAVQALNEKIAADFAANVETKGLAAATDIATEALTRGRKKILDTADAAGYSRGEVKKMQDRMLLTPEELETQINTPGLDQARTKVDKFGREVRSLKDKEIDITASFSIEASKAVRSLNKNIIAKYGKGGRQIALSTGGSVWGEGTATSDDIPTMLSNGEEVVRTWAAERTRPALKFINAHGRVPTDREREMLHLARGGTVHRDIDAYGALRNPYTVSARPFSGSESLFDRGATDYMQGLADAYVAALQDVQDDVVGSFGKIDVSQPRSLTTFRGHRFTNLFAATLRAAERDAGRNFSIFQGGFRPRTSYSGTSHAGDAIDHQVDYALMRAARRKGVADWDRTGRGNWAPHMHGVPLPGAGYAGGSAIWQAQDYLRGGDGLWTGTKSATPGFHWTAERGAELVVSPQLRHYGGGEQVLNAAQTQAALQPVASSVQIDNAALQAAVRDGAREGIEKHLRTLSPRELVGVVRAANHYADSRGGGR